MKKVIGLLVVALAAGAAHAQVVIDADVTFAPGIGAITAGGTTNNTPSEWTYWTFFATAGDALEIEVNRLVGELDPVAAIVEGDLTGATFGGNIFSDPIMGLDVVGYSDDTDPANIPGPYGDPHAYFLAPSTGVYTICVSSYASDVIPEEGYVHEVIVRGNTVPAPAAAGLFGIFGAFASRRRRA